ncbi:MAG: CNNM domain-containing protein, partial [Oscillospiraceae bacterium]|nr:CNNM domain-containing protein [Oscillospiraceae bacterium]
MEWWRIIVILVIILASGFFSSGETAITGVNRIRLKHKAETGNLAAKRALKLLEKYDMMLATLLIGNNIVTLVVASVSTLFAVDLAASMNWDEALTVAVVTAILTVILILFSDILPKTVAREHADDFILICSKALAVTVWIFIPLTALTLLFQRGVTRLFRKGSKEVSVTEQELMQIIDEIEDEGVLEEHESDLVRSALEFDETTVEEIMTPRVNIIAVAKTDSASEVCNVFFDEGYSRLPVY